MASLSDLETWLLIYLGTKSTDPAYPAATRQMLINRAYLELVSDTHDLDPGYHSSNTTLQASDPTSHVYIDLPANFAKVVVLRVENENGVALTEVRREEIVAAGDFMPAYYLQSWDENAVITTSSGVSAGTPLWLEYSYWPNELANPGDVPELPKAFHDVIALKAAEIAFALGGEQKMPPELKAHLDDRVGQFWFRVSRRSGDPKTLKG